MDLFKFIFSKTFLKQLGFAFIAGVALIFLLLQWLKSSTNHGDYITVPDLSKKTMNEATKLINEANLQLVMQDSTDFNAKYPRFSIIEQNPPAGGKVKKNRKIYVILNPSGYRKVTVPNVIQVTRRNAESMLLAVGLDVEKVTYIDELGKDMVYYIKHKGENILPGSQLTKTTKVELVCGNGNQDNHRRNEIGGDNGGE
ncbi:PASTA domain-containing protein [Leptobacterium flavescens]|uniref:PASTA domain-containing protein n=1 Tax=Leptobacterium flavescens TaxID=472055 RepID=A0A6P0UKF7_9FLAO|nr:PASTA domain-containing protein [Leptobacterium flavescens]NER12349.1 PASTA domain-containing protein [Leptobacterium flavescens]